MTGHDDTGGRDEAASRHKGPDQHGWSPDVDSTRKGENDSAHRSFHTDEYAPEADRERPDRVGDDASPEGAGESVGRSGEDVARRPGEEQGTHAHGTKGPSERPSGGEDATAVTGVDPQDPGEE